MYMGWINKLIRMRIFKNILLVLDTIDTNP